VIDQRDGRSFFAALSLNAAASAPASFARFHSKPIRKMATMPGVK